jgi:long-chain acyl-CoA synthetase
MFRAIKERGVTMMIVVPLALEILTRGIESEVRRQGAWSRWEVLHRVAARAPMRLRRLLFWRVRQQIGPSLEFFFCGGARLAPALAARWEHMGIAVIEGYGATECAPVVASNTPTRRHRGTVGQPIRDVEVRIASDGEVQVSGENVTSGYWRNEEATAAAFTTDGWYRTGDLAQWRGSDLVLNGRLGDLIVLPSGMNVFPEDVEAELVKEECIAACVVLGLPDAQGDSAVRAIVIPTQKALGRQDLREQLTAAVQRANARLARHQRIQSHSIWPEGDFPRTTSMKVKRGEIRARLTKDAM